MEQNNSLGKSFLNAFSNNLQSDNNKKVNSVQAPTLLSNKMGLNKKKVSNLQQNMIKSIQSTPQQL